MTWTIQALLWLAVWIALGSGLRLLLSAREQQRGHRHHDHS